MSSSSDQPAPLRLEVEPERHTLPAAFEGDQHVLVTVRCLADQRPSGQRAVTMPRSVIFVIDASGSMTGRPLAEVSAAVLWQVERMTEQDRVAVVAFDRAAHCVAPFTSLDADGRGRVRDAVLGIISGGGTNLSAALALGQSLLAGEDEQRHKMLALFSDGEPSVGVCDPAALVQLVREWRDVTLVALGFGPHYDPRLLGALAAAGHGPHRFIEGSSACRSETSEAFGQVTAARFLQPRLALTAGRGVRLLSATHPRIDSTDIARGGTGTLELRLPDLVAGDELGVMVRVRVRTHAGSIGVAARALLVAEVSAREGSNAAPKAVNAEAMVRLSAHGAGARTPGVRAHLALMRCDALREEGRAALEDERLDDAISLLNVALGELEAAQRSVAAHGQHHPELRRKLDEADHIVRSECAAWRGTRTRHDTLVAVRRSCVTHLGCHTVSHAMPRAWLEIWPDYPSASLVALGSIETLGRRYDSSIYLDDPSVSREHALLVETSSGYLLKALDTTNATQVDGEVVEPGTARLLQDGAVLQLGGVPLRYGSTDR